MAGWPAMTSARLSSSPPESLRPISPPLARPRDAVRRGRLARARPDPGPKAESFFTLLGVCIGVMFLIAVISIVQGMSSYMENEFAAKLLGVNTFTLRRFPWFGDGAGSEEEWRAWLRRPRV